jgi:hypothetical protein
MAQMEIGERSKKRNNLIGTGDNDKRYHYFPYYMPISAPPTLAAEMGRDIVILSKNEFWMLEHRKSIGARGRKVDCYLTK